MGSVEGCRASQKEEPLGRGGKMGSERGTGQCRQDHPGFRGLQSRAGVHPKTGTVRKKGELVPHFYTEIPMWFKLDEFLITCQLLARLRTMLHTMNSYNFNSQNMQRSFCYYCY